MELTQKHFENGKVAYNAYCQQTGGVSLISGDELPEFGALGLSIREAWAAVYIAIALKEDMLRRT